MKILITGATGLIGKKLVDSLLDKGHAIHYLSTSKNKIVAQKNYQGFFWDPTKGLIDEKCLEGVEAIIHLAGANIAKRWTPSYKQELIDSRVNSTKLLYKIVQNNSQQIKQIISASGTAIYPESYSKVYDETTVEVGKDFLTDLVLKWEKEVNKFDRESMIVTKLRTGIVFSNQGGALPKMVSPIKMGFGAVIGTGKQIQSWIHIDDLVNMYIHVLEHQISGVYNAVAPNPVTATQLTHTIAKVLGRRILLPNIPKFIMKLFFGEMAELLFSSKNLSAKKIKNTGFKFLFPKADKAIKDLYK